jgi:hypothetical protein
MLHVRTFASCLAVACAAAPLLPANALPARPRDLTQVRLRTLAHAGVRPNQTSRGSIGSGNTTTADAPVPRPNESACVVTLFSGATFAAYSAQTFPYSPPSGCPGPYAKIVFNGNFSVSAGVQFDRTAQIEIGNAPIFFGTTPEPTPNLGPTWHVERDVTEDAALLASPSTTEADIFNIVDPTYTGVISGTAFLQFYPADYSYPAPATPSVVLPFPGVPGGAQALDTGSSVLSATYTLPTNVTSAYMDIYAENQSNDEFYYTCAPNNIASELNTCGNGPFRETEVAIDGMPAGDALIYPRVFTGGIDPYLWSPIPGVQTLEFVPSRVNLTPFAAILANGRPHTITLSVANADNYFQAIATLYAYQDPGSTTVTGALTKDTLAANPQPSVVERVNPNTLDGSIFVGSNQSYQISGYVNTSQGVVRTTVSSDLFFTNTQTYANESATTGTSTYDQVTTASTAVATTVGKGRTVVQGETISFPISLVSIYKTDDAGNGTYANTVVQRFIDNTSGGSIGGPATNVVDTVASTDTLILAGGAFTGADTGQKSSQTYVASDSLGDCYAQSIAAVDSILTSVTKPPCIHDAARRAR